MSSYIKKLKNPKTGKMQEVLCLDGYYGGHKYGYAFRKDGKDADWNNCEDYEFDYFKEGEL